MPPQSKGKFSQAFSQLALTSKKPPTFDFPVPVEILRDIIELLDAADQRRMSLVSRATREQAIEFIFK
ncbi:hypothetical protein H0H92_010709 [Tricholoma furcatifolium]|nr:hypothetical protein H0H92_010709 [Tricholoma furcatifolium]